MKERSNYKGKKNRKKGGAQGEVQRTTSIKLEVHTKKKAPPKKGKR